MRFPLPGKKAQDKMLPPGVRNFSPPKTATPASVLFTLYPVMDEPWIVFIKRTEYSGAHSGQISLPGGKIEKTDKDFEFAALRETSEELGVPMEDIKIVGKLSLLHIPVSGFEVHPYIGILNTKPEWKTDANEVSYLIETPISNIIKPDAVKIELWNLRGAATEIPFYYINGEKIWGATAMMVSEFLEILHTFC